MPRAKVTTTFGKAKPKKKVGRPKGSTTKVTRRPPAEVTDLQEYLNAHEGEKPYLKLREDFQAECDHGLWPQELVATQGPNKWMRCTGCRILRKSRQAL